MNDGTDAGGGVPCHANAIERTNLQQKKDAKWERQKVLQFAQSQAEQVSQLSMNDLSFGDKITVKPLAILITLSNYRNLKYYFAGCGSLDTPFTHLALVSGLCST